MDSGLSVGGVFAHPSHTDWSLLLTLASDAGPGVQMTSVDLSGVLKTSCQLVDDPGSVASDFERWSPADALEDAHMSKRPACLLGVRTSYVRRKADHRCKTKSAAVVLAPLDLRKDTPCLCTAEDWSCDAGFHHTSYEKGAPCEPLEAQPNLSSLCAETTARLVTVSQGYVKMPGSGCHGGVELSPKQEVCLGNVGVVATLRRLLPGWRTLGAAALATLLATLALLALQHQRGKGGFGLGKAGGEKEKLAGVIGRIQGYGLARTPRDEDEDSEREFLIGER